MASMEMMRRGDPARGLLLAGLGGAIATLGLRMPELWPLFAWSGAVFLAIGGAYWIGTPKVFGKDEHGALPLVRVVALLPFLLPTWLVWHLLRLLSGGADAWHQVAPGVFLGRRCYAHELPDDLDVICDLTAELTEPTAVRAHAGYLCVPTLDSHAPPSLDSIRAALDRCAAARRVFVHCDSGHGRSAAFVAALLVRKGLAGTATSAEHQVVAARPGVRLSLRQRLWLRQIEQLESLGRVRREHDGEP
jgi:protein-tyrosine phosphatase